MLKDLQPHRFEYVICEGELMSLDDALDAYGVEGMGTLCTEIFLEITVWARNWAEARKKLVKWLPKIVEDLEKVRK